jgi:hypothetical protein
MLAFIVLMRSESLKNIYLKKLLLHSMTLDGILHLMKNFVFLMLEFI